jgi:hypothetical protein
MPGRSGCATRINDFGNRSRFAVDGLQLIKTDPPVGRYEARCNYEFFFESLEKIMQINKTAAGIN